MVAVVVPEKALVEKWAEDHGIKGSYAEVLTDAKVKQFFLEEMKIKAKEAGVKFLYLLYL